MKITLPDGSAREYSADSPVTPARVAADIGAGLAKAAIAAKVDDVLWDLNRPLERDCRLSIITKPKLAKDGRSQFRDAQHQNDALYVLRHSTAHVMAEAICKLWPQTQLAYGPPTDNGFYYDISLDQPISVDDFPKIEAEMGKIVAENRPFKRIELDPESGFQRLHIEGNRYKLDNADRAVKGGAQKLSWYVTGSLQRVKSKVGNGESWVVPIGGQNPAQPRFLRALIAPHGQDTSVLDLWDEVGLDDLGEILDRGNWEDLCQGPHVPATGVIGAFKVLNVAASHWHGDITKDRFQRIYGTAFFAKADLDAYLAQLEEAKQRDHRVIGQRLGLFTIDEMVGQGLVLWKPRGAMVRSILQQFIQDELLHRGYDLVFTPNIGKIDLYKTSGHYPYYADSQFPPIRMKDQAGGQGGEEEYLLKPMNCPHHIRIYASDPHSYRDLPVRLAEFGTVYRFEQSGELTGMTRVRGFTQDDAHIFCTHEQVQGEFRATVELVQFVFKTFGFEDVAIRLSLRDPSPGKAEKYVGDPRNWDTAEQELRDVLKDMKVPHEEAKGEAAFYGPKVDFIIRDVIGRPWQLGTVQLDYNLPQRFKLEYIGADNSAHQPVMIHRAPFGSMERFMAILIEHYAGAFPLWLAPEQMRVLTISEKFDAYGAKVLSALIAAGFRATLDKSGERVQAKVKIAQDAKVPYMLVVGGRDETAGTVSVRERIKGDLGAMTLEAFIAKAKTEIDARGQAARADRVVRVLADHDRDWRVWF